MNGAGNATRGTLRGRSRTVVRSVLLAGSRAAVRLRIEGIEHVPAHGPVLVACNHLSNADPALLAGRPAGAVVRALDGVEAAGVERRPRAATVGRDVGARRAHRQHGACRVRHPRRP